MIRILAAIGGFLSFFLPATVNAQAMPVICTGLAGCGQGPENTLFHNVLPAAIALMIQAVAGASVVFILVNGVKMLISAGDDSKAGAARKGVMAALGGLGVAILSATAVSFLSTENYGQANPTNFLFGAGGLLDSVVRIILVLFNAGFVIMIIYAGITMALASGNADGFKKGGQIIKWALAGALTVNLARALVQAFLAFQF
jgi:hypothetical protein